MLIRMPSSIGSSPPSIPIDFDDIPTTLFAVPQQYMACTAIGRDIIHNTQVALLGLSRLKEDLWSGLTTH